MIIILYWYSLSIYWIENVLDALYCEYIHTPEKLIHNPLIGLSANNTVLTIPFSIKVKQQTLLHFMVGPMLARYGLKAISCLHCILTDEQLSII